MKTQFIKIGVISNKAFLLLVTDAINTLEIKNRETKSGDIINTDYVNIVSETKVEAYYSSASRSKPISTKYKVSYLFEYDSVGIQIYLLNIILNGQSVPRHVLDNPKIKCEMDELLQKTITDHKDTLVPLIEKIQSYEDLSCQLTDDSIYNGALFDTLPDLNLQLYLCKKTENKVHNSNNHQNYNEHSIAFKLGILFGVVENNWKLVFGILVLIIIIMVIL